MPPEDWLAYDILNVLWSRLRNIVYPGEILCCTLVPMGYEKRKVFTAMVRLGLDQWNMFTQGGVKNMIDRSIRTYVEEICKLNGQGIILSSQLITTNYKRKRNF